MNIQQFQYILALAETRHYEKAAEKSFISQSTLSTMISKFEDEIGVLIFDRKKKPLTVTTEGKIILEQIKKISKEIESLDEIANQLKGEVKGKLNIAVIPTIAPFLLPLFLPDFAEKFPNLNIEVKEHTTEEIMRLIKSRDLDIGIISIPVNDKEIVEHHLYDEPFVFYDTAHKHKKKADVKDLDLSNLCLLEEGHCMRTQVLELCDYHNKQLINKLNFKYKAGSIDSLLRFVNASKASTLLPYLAAIDLTEKEKRRVSHFVEPVPFRSVGLVVHTHFVKKKVLELLQVEIQSKILPLLPKVSSKAQMLNPV
ncbi:MAG: LysR substrate-binding domain-containing protein [Flavobacteriales bacterium]